MPGIDIPSLVMPGIDIPSLVMPGIDIPSLVMPVKTGIQVMPSWIPACAGMTMKDA